MFDWLTQKYRQQLDRTFVFYKKSGNRICGSRIVNEICNFIQTAVVYAYLIYQVWFDIITLGDFTVYLNAINQFSGSMKSIMDSITNIYAFKPYYDAVEDFFNIPTHTESGSQKLRKSENNDTIEFRHVSFRYAGTQNYALKDINLKITSGEKYSIVGENGAGKTTFISLLMGLYKPSKGIITYNGVNIETIDYTDYISLFAPVMQNYHIFDFRIIDNLVFPTDEKITHDRLQAIQQVIDDLGLTKTINALSNGLETYITQTFSDEGVELSGGETQKLAFARCLCADAQVMILDEPTSSLSPQSEFEIYNGFGSISHSKTVLFISHRTQWDIYKSIQQSDRIVWPEDFGIN